jgi:hypothetical protein
MQIEHATPTLKNASHTLNPTSLTLYPVSFCHLQGARGRQAAKRRHISRSL